MPRRPPGSRTGSVWDRPDPAPSRAAAAPSFSREEITRAAIALADGQGLEAVSMRRIAERIGSAPTSIYWYVSDKGELYELMLDAVLGEIGLPDASADDLRADLSSLAWATLATARRHRWCAQIGIQPVPGPATQRYAAVMLPILARSGIDETAGVSVLATLNNFIFGFIQREAAWQQLDDRAKAREAAQADSAGTPGGRSGQPPMTSEGITARMRLSGDESFAFGLDLFLDGIAVLADSLSARPDQKDALQPLARM